MQGELENRMLPDSEFTILMPLFKNVPEPRDPTWQPTVCPVCRRRCWFDPAGEEFIRLAKGAVRIRCTECGLQNR